MKQITIILSLTLASIFSFSQDWKTYPYTPDGSVISFPMDEGWHAEETTEWWYTTGHVTGSVTGKKYSYMLSYFYFPAGFIDGFRILNISDDDNFEFFTSTEFVTYNSLATDELNINANILSGGTETWTNKLDGANNPLPFQYEIEASSDDVTLSLQYDALKPPLILSDDGFLNQGYEFYTYYYSQTKNAVTGTITFDGITEEVTGTSWIDRQYGNFMPSADSPYEWFSIQLSNGMDINMWNIFTTDLIVPEGEEFRVMATYVDTATQYTSTDFNIQRLEYDFMPDGQKCYAQKWRLTEEEHNIDLIITTLYSNAEVFTPFRFYEGTTVITGTVDGVDVTGQGFTELLHSYEHPDIALVNQDFWNAAIPVEWGLNNPDEGNPISYDLEYSVDNQNNFLPIESDLNSNSYNWNDSPLTEGQSFWLKVKGYSIDHTLVGEDVSELVYTTNIAVEEEPQINPIVMYPNPSSGFLTIESKQVSFIEIIDVEGKVAYSSEITSDKVTVDLSKLAKGNYLVQGSGNGKRFVGSVILE